MERDKLGVASPWAVHSCEELGLPESTPLPCLGHCILEKGSPQPGAVPAGGRLPSRTSGWGHHSYWEKEVMCWMLRHLPDVRTLSFFLPLRPLDPASASCGMGMLGPGVAPPQMGRSRLRV